MSSVNACIYFHPDGYTTAGRQIMGRHAAGESFLRGFLLGTHGQDLWIQVEEPQHVAQFQSIARSFGRTEPLHAVDRRRSAELAEPGLVFYPGPGLADEAFKRACFGHRSWSLCGITHTTCSARVMDSIVALHTAPLHPWDAVICTSEAVLTSVQTVLAAQEAYLRERLGCSRVVLPQLPVIPLGIHAEDFEVSASTRQAARRSLGAETDTLVVMFMGRLAFHAKAHPLAMYQALERSAQAAGVQVVLVECGWHANDYIRDAYSQAAAAICPSVTVVPLDGRDPEQRTRAWAGADVFCSLADNIQETFGLTPLEAMAAGLPVVVSDWDGYKDTVRDGIDGFRIPTLMAPAGLGADLAGRHALDLDTYDLYCGYSSSFVSVDVQATTAAFTRLFSSAELRRRMGEEGRRRVRSSFDWTAIMPRYQELWAELNQIRGCSPELPAAAQQWPGRLDPFEAFACYPSQTLTPTTPLILAEPDLQKTLQRFAQLFELTMVSFAAPVLPSRAELEQLLRAASPGPRPVRELLGALAANRRALMFRALAWLIKLDLLRVVAPAG